ncbi:MAG TPA: hypothetical protein PKN47_18300 [Nitrospira sp.]|nr:hypothetical protein [Nitrospira sp.]
MAAKKRKLPEEAIPAPLDSKTLARKLRSRVATGPAPDWLLEFSVHLAGNVRAEIAGGSETPLKIVARGAKLGEYAFPPSIPTRKYSDSRKLMKEVDYPEALTGLLPDHLDLKLTPNAVPRSMRAPARIDSLVKLRRGMVHATTVFRPDDRRVFQDTAFPWCTTGRVDSPNGTGSGVMIGPRHLLTVSHIIQWNSDKTAGWVKFTPAYFDGSAPFGEAWATLTYYEVKVSGPTLDGNEQKHDYVCIVLDRRIGDITGWMGSRAYSTSWDNGNYWRHIGYPGDLTGSSRPSYQRDISFTGTDGPSEHRRINHMGDVWPGQSGGPYFAWWDNEPWPRVVAVQSGQEPSTNTASSGNHMVDLVIRARNEHP